jgi:hypothetical protein
MSHIVVALVFAVVGALGYLAFSRQPTPQSQLAHLFDVSYWCGFAAIVYLLCVVGV